MHFLKDVSFLPETCSTRDVAQALGLAVRSVQLMVDRGELEAWKTPGGHRRIARASVQRWLARHQTQAGAALPCKHGRRPRVLLIEDSLHIQDVVRRLLGQHFPEIELHVANDGIVGLAMAGQLQPEVLLVDIVLPNVDGSTLVNRWCSHPQFAGSELIVLTGLDAGQQAPYAFALAGVPVVHKPQLVQQLPGLLAACLQAQNAGAPLTIGGKFAS